MKTTTVVSSQRRVDMTAKMTQVLHAKHTRHVKFYFKVILLMNLVPALTEMVDLRVRDQLLKKWHSLKKASTNFVRRELLVSVWGNVRRYAKVSCWKLTIAFKACAGNIF